MATARDWDSVLSEHLDVAGQLRDAGGVLERIAEALIACLREGRRVYVLGNGGSAADAQHVATELLGRFKIDRAPLAVMALTTDTSGLTAIGNDLGFEQVFARQVTGLARHGDIVWILSTSGNSPNVLAAASAARERGAITIAFTGRTGGKLANLCDYVFRVPHDCSDRIQEGHELAYHFLCERVEAALATHGEKVKT